MRTIVAVLTLPLLVASLLAGFLVDLVLADEPHAANEPSFHVGSWPFKPLQRPEVPDVDNDAACLTPVDSFVLDKLEDKELSLSPLADKLTLLRRAYLDLTGLLPTVEEQDAFIRDDRVDSFERLVDRLLASPRYGERWARHWLDIVRFAESAGFKIDETRADAYKYRDYVVAAWNKDTPYDRFITEQLAGDELADGPESLVATGLNRLYPEESNASNFRLSRQQILDNLTETTSLALMGLTMGCAKCHDHKFDPVTQTDFFRLQACFAPMIARNDQTTATSEECRVFAEKKAVYDQATKTIRDEMDAMTKAIWPLAFEEVVQALDADSAKALRTAPEERTALQAALASLADREITKKMGRLPRRLDENSKKRFDELAVQLASFDSIKPVPLPTIMSVTEPEMEPPQTFVLAIGDYRKPLEAVEPGFPEFLGREKLDLPESDRPKKSSGRRLALARWLSRKDHPLTSRVMVNRIWQHLFGTGIEPSANDFGAMGEPVTNREVLDWTSAEFVSRDWSVKSIQRLLTTSSTYRQTSTIYPNLAIHQKGVKVDGDNKFLWHANRRRLESEPIRDVMLQVSGDLNLRMFGASARGRLPDAIRKNSRYSWEPDTNYFDQCRRSIFTYGRRNLQLPLLAAFDPPDVYQSTPQRGETVTATQTLTILNNEFTLEQSKHWAGQLLLTGETNVATLVQMAYLQAFSRRADSMEVEAAEQFLQRQTATATGVIPIELLPEPCPNKLSPAFAASLVDFCHAILNSNEFQFVD